MELELQKFLRQYNKPKYGFADLETKYGVKAKQHTRVPNLWLFKYSQIESPFKEQIVQESRGIVLDADNDWAVVAMPYKKFFNYGEALAHDINWATAEVQEKLDGSLITMYHYNDKWWVATSGTADAATPVGDFGTTFEDLFWSTFDKEGLSLRKFNPEYTYIFELCAPQNRVVVRHSEQKLFLHGVRRLKDLKELSCEIIAMYLGCRSPATYEVSTVEECLEAAKHLKPLENEGYVVVDSNFNRLKIKSPAYLVLHHAKDSLLSRKKMAMLIRNGESSEFQTALEAYPELAAEFWKLDTTYKAIVKICLDCYRKISAIADQKFFAITLKTEYSEVPESILFKMRKNPKCTPQQAMSELTDNAYLRIMGVKD